MNSQLLIASLLLTAAPALAEPVEISVSPRSERVTYADLDLSSPDGKLKLERRIRGAAHRVCEVAGMPSLDEFALQHRCFTTAMKKGLNQMERVAAKPGHSAQATTAAILVSGR